VANATVNYGGAINGGSDKRELYLKLFSGEVISQFEEKTVVLDKHTIHTITEGKSSSFPVMGNMPDAEYHTPGTEILGQVVPQAEKILTLDSLLISHVFIDNLDEKMKHFETRSKYSKLMGSKLAKTFDNHVMRNFVLAAKSAATVTGTNGGLKVLDANLASATAADKFTAWESFLYQCAENFVNKNVDGKAYCILKPADYFFLAKYVSTNGFSGVHKDYSNSNGSWAEGKIIQIAGIELVPSPMLPTVDYTSDTYHKIDCRNVKAICFTEDAVGTIKLMDISLQSEWDIRRQGTLMVASYAMGHGVLQPECAVVGMTADPV